MDLLFKKYASPFLLLNGYIQTGRFCEFVENFKKQQFEDEKWEFWLHKVWDKSYTDYCSDIETTQKLKQMSKYEAETIIQKSNNILKNFNPTQGEGGV